MRPLSNRDRAELEEALRWCELKGDDLAGWYRERLEEDDRARKAWRREHPELEVPR